jgi:hypothetical protein
VTTTVWIFIAAIVLPAVLSLSLEEYARQLISEFWWAAMLSAAVAVTRQGRISVRSLEWTAATTWVLIQVQSMLPSAVWKFREAWGHAGIDLQAVVAALSGLAFLAWAGVSVWGSRLAHRALKVAGIIEGAGLAVVGLYLLRMALFLYAVSRISERFWSIWWEATLLKIVCGAGTVLLLGAEVVRRRWTPGTRVG